MIRVGAAPGRSQAEEEWTNPKQSLPRTPLNTHKKYNMTRPSITLVHIGSVLTKVRPEGLPSLYSTRLLQFPLPCNQRVAKSGEH